MARLGFANPALDRAARRFLRRFRSPVSVKELSREEMATARVYLDAHFLMAFRAW
jgi:hypothetical protein